MTTKIPDRMIKDLGSFSGDLIPDNSTIKQSIQVLETAVAAIGVPGDTVVLLASINTVLGRV